MSTPAAWPLWQKILLPAVLLVLGWEILPTLDLMVSGWAYRAGEDGFWMRETWPAMLVYRDTRYMVIAIVIGLIGAIACGLAVRSPVGKALARRAALVLLAMAIGPGLIVHTVFKNQWGRPRPAEIVNFGGTGHYVAPGILSNQCARNCSFVSGHASSGYILAAGLLLWPRQRRRWLVVGFGAGTLIGIVRIIQGAHFFSDVIGSAVIVTGTVLIIENWASKRGWLALPAA